MSKARAALLSAALFLAFGLLALLSYAGFMPPEGAAIHAAQADPAAVMAGRDDENTEALELLPGEKIDINSASPAALQKLPGIGEVLSQAIVDYREANGPFARPEDIMQVAGIGRGRYEAIAGSITVGET